MRNKRLYILCMTGILAFVSNIFIMDVSTAISEGESKQVVVRGQIKSINIAKGEMAFLPRYSNEALLVKVPERDLLKGWKDGDKVKLTYRPGKQNVAERISEIGEKVIPVGCGSH